MHVTLEATPEPHFIFLQEMKTTWQIYELQKGSDTTATCFMEMERHAVLVQVAILQEVFAKH